MLKKICLSLFVLLLIVITTVLLLPLSLFQGHIVDLVNSSGLVELRLDRPISYRLIDAQKISATEVNIKSSGYEVFLDEITIDVNLGSLLKRDIIIDALNVKVKSFKEIEKNIKAPKKKKIERLDNTSRTPLDSVVINNFSLDIEKVHIEKHVIDDISLSSKKVALSVTPLLIESEFDISVFKEAVKGSISLDKKDAQSFSLNVLLRDIAKMSNHFDLSNINLYGDINLQLNGLLKNQKDILGNPMSLVINGKKLKWTGKDLDKILDAYIDSKKVGLLDAAGYLALGPIGILVAKGTDLGHAGIRGITRGETQIRELHADIILADKVISLQDVAVATAEHKVVAKGKVNLKDMVFKDFSVASVDEKGCSVFIQGIKGPLSSPEIGALGSFVNEVFSPVSDLFNRGLSLITDNCDKHYQGVVK